MAEHVTFDVDDPVLAAAAWSRLAEPGDTAAGTIVAALGASRALRWVLAEPTEAPCDPPDLPRWLRARQRWLPRLEALAPAREVGVIASLGGTLLHPGDPRWPERLVDLGTTSPHCLWVRGRAELLDRGGVALVGARASTGYGEHVAGELAASLAATGTTIVSGGAYGIDAVAHRAALAVEGPTVAVMAGGLDRFYPQGNAALLQRVASDGCVVSELPPGSAPSRSRFLTRNRLIAALADVCVVVEAGWRSGTLSTAGHAAALLRPVGAVPGPVTSAASAGCHRLLREGVAVCVTDAEEVRELLGPVGDVVVAEPETRRAADVPAGLTEVQGQVWDALPLRGTGTLASVARTSGLAVGEVRAALGVLELRGYVVREGEHLRRTRR